MRRPLLSLAPLALALSAAPAHTQTNTQAGDVAAEAVMVYLDRVKALDDSGPMLNAVIATNPAAADEARAASEAGLPLAGRTVLVKDNIETRELPTTAGSLALAQNDTGRDAPLIARLREAGGVVLGKANLSEWANIRSPRSTSGWSATGGMTRNPHAIDRNSCGSSAGSAAAVAAEMAWAAIGTETDGSITCPASITGIVGFKPTVGMVSRTHVVPISVSQDTAGPMARNVHDAAMLLTAIAGSDPDDPATAEAAGHLTDFADGLDSASLQGVRLGVMRGQIGNNPQVAAVFEQALEDLRGAGAELVDVDYEEPGEMGTGEFTVLLYELREGLDAYLAGSPADIPVRSLGDVIRFNEEHAGDEMRWFGQEFFEMALQNTDEAAYHEARATSLRLAGEEGIDRLLAEHDVAALIVPTRGPAWPIDLVLGDNFDGSIGAGSLAAIAGYPHLTVPMGGVEDLPVGISFMGAKWDDAAILRLGAAYEKVRSADIPDPDFVRWNEE